MGQQEIMEWLIIRRLTGDDKYYSAKEIEKQLRAGKIWKQVQILFAYGYLDIKTKGFKRKFRIKDKYVKIENLSNYSNYIISSPSTKTSKEIEV
jgi:hypothetical protein